MNFISVVMAGEIPMELKYCERCGGLWLRREGETGVHCAECRARIAVQGRMFRKVCRRRAAKPIAPIGSLFGVAEMEVRA